MTTDFITEIENKINTYKKNRENIPLEVLKSKYARAYNQLIEDIEHGAELIISHYAYEGIRIRTEDIKTFVPKLDAALEADGLTKRVSRLIFKEYNLQGAIEEAKKYRQTVAERMYQEYQNGQTEKNLDP